MEVIVKAEDQEYILEDDLIRVIGFEKIDSLVNYNFLHHQSTNNFTNDIINSLNEIILIAINQLSLCVMECLLHKVLSSKK